VNIVSKSELRARKVSIARFEVLVAMAMKFQFWHVTPCRLVNSYRRFEDLSASIFKYLLLLLYPEDWHSASPKRL